MTRLEHRRLPRKTSGIGRMSFQLTSRPRLPPNRCLRGMTALGLVRFAAGVVRQVFREAESTVVMCRDTEDPIPGHVLICGKTTSGMARKLKVRCRSGLMAGGRFGYRTDPGASPYSHPLGAPNSAVRQLGYGRYLAFAEPGEDPVLRGGSHPVRLSLRRAYARGSLGLPRRPRGRSPGAVAGGGSAAWGIPRGPPAQTARPLARARLAILGQWTHGIFLRTRLKIIDDFRFGKRAR